jgi:acyl carrier protein
MLRMEGHSVDERLRALMAEVLDISATQVQPEMTRANTAAWDSMNHLRLITALEAEFGISLTMEQIAAITSAADLERIVSPGTANGLQYQQH